MAVGSEVGEDRPKVFFVHIMRTGGGSLAQMLQAAHGPGEVYPDPACEDDLVAANIEIPYLLGLSEERRRGIRVYTGHFPYYVTELVEPGLLTTTIVREPVQRTISYLQMKLREMDNAVSVEDLYRYPVFNDSTLRNFQTRQFALTADDGAVRAIHPLAVDDERLALAKRNLARVDVLGLSERYEDYLAALRAKFGWNLRRIDPWHVSDPIEVSESLRERIAEDNAADSALYAHAVELHRRRSAG